MTKSWKSSVDFLDKFVSDSHKLTPEQTYFTYKGILFPVAACKPETIQALETFEARLDDIFLCGYRKTGTNWVEHILNHLAITAAKYTEEEVEERISIARELAITPRLEFGDPDKFKKMEKLPSRRIIVTHLHPHMLPTSIFRNKAKVLVLIRNPKDTMVSSFHFRNKLSSFPVSTWDEYFTDYMNGKVSGGSYFDYVKRWDKYIDDENVMGISYEELKENLNLGVQKIAKFFGLSLNNEEIEGVVEKSSIDALKERAHETHGLFGAILFSKGHVGNWKSMFTESQSQAMDKKFEEHLAGTKLGAKVKYDVYGTARCEAGAPPFENIPVARNGS
ncbi:sulfotransferase 6B1-like [Sceloporus undulatus]|uniref:sulfotransferase 6B1-like n=1 Tax=Sceloporus undulatus TaxID=8520 RepID=UPI001C4B6702|nr:sulfotransferase 6B1-like [Sceloporus undulatus]